MLKKSFFFVFILFCNGIYAGTIHTTVVKGSKFCANLAVSTKLGKKSENSQCIYQKETTPEGSDSCVFDLNAYFLEKNMGFGFDCAATHIHSNLTGSDGVDEYQLISNSNGHYVGTNPSQGNVTVQ